MTGLAARALAKVAEETGLSKDELTVVSQSEEMWRDSSLGCPQPGQMYMQVITPGMRFVIEGGGQRYNVHTDQSGGSAILCNSPQEGGSVDK